MESSDERRQEGLGEPGSDPRGARRGALSRERLTALRKWVRDGGPDRPDVLEAVARRMVERGEP